jgi:flagellar motor protein MotB
MSKRPLVILSLAVSAFAAVGCVSPNLQLKLDEVTREKEEVERQKAEVEADLLACKARCDSLERSRGAGGARPPAAALDMPGDLKGKVDIRRRGSDTVIDVPSDVFFASGSATLNASGDRTMGQICDFIRKNHPNGLVRVEGHSDSDPIRRTKSRYHCNWELSFERAHAVMHYLVDKGRLDPHRVVCEAYGEFHPQEPGNKSKNRRVEIVIAQR